MPTRRSAAVRYAKALFGLAQETGRIDGIRTELDGLVASIEQVPALADVFVRPIHPARERRSALAELAAPLGLSPLVANFCAYLIDQRRTRDLAAIRDEFVRLAEEAAGRVRGEVVSAAPLEAAQLEGVRRALSRRIGREIDLSVRIDPELVGGVVARVGDLVFDGSLRTQLAQLRAQLTGER